MTDFHFLLTSIGEWRTGTDLHGLMREMDRETMTYVIWLVPGGDTTSYEIRFYTPQVEGAYILQTVHYKDGKRTK